MAFTQLYAHLVWATWQRERWVTESVEREVWAAIAESCRKLRCDPIIVGGMPDHVHVLVEFPVSLAIARLAHDVKGASSHLMTHVLKPGESFKWQDGYGAFTLRKDEAATVARYIGRQKQHHAAGSLSPLMGAHRLLSNPLQRVL